MMAEWSRIEVDLGDRKIGFVRERAGQDASWSKIEDDMILVIEETIERKAKDAFLLFSEQTWEAQRQMSSEEQEQLFAYLERGLGRRYRYYILSGLLRIFLLRAQGGRISCVQIKADRLPWSGKVRTEIFPALSSDGEGGERREMRIMIRAWEPAGQRGGRGLREMGEAVSAGRTDIPVIHRGREIARGHFEETGAALPERFLNCELVC